MDDLVLPFPKSAGQVDTELLCALEACLFASGSALTPQVLAAALDRPADEIRVGLRQLATSSASRGVVVERVGPGWQMRTSPRYGAVIHRLLGTKPKKLSRAAVEALSVIAWQQPATRGDVDSVRGVDSGGVIKALIDQGLIRVSGRRSEPGRPLEYRTTAAFLEIFGLPNLRSLPTLKERLALERERSPDDEDRFG